MLFQSSRNKKQIRRKTRDEDDQQDENEQNQQQQQQKENDNNNSSAMNIEPITSSTKNIDINDVNNNSNSTNIEKNKSATVITKKKQQTTTTKKKSRLLSFGDDEDTSHDNGNDSGSNSDGNKQSVYSLQNQTLKKSQFSRASSDLAVNATHSSPIGEYTSEKLDLLRRDTSIRRTTNIGNQQENQQDIEIKNIIDLEDEYNGNQSSSQLPTFEQIKAAREKRQRMREGKDTATTSESSSSSNNISNQDDFIPLSTTISTARKDKNKDTRVKDKDDEEDDDDDDEEDVINTSKKDKNRIHFGDPGKSATSRFGNDENNYTNTIETGTSSSNKNNNSNKNILINNNDDDYDEEDDEELQRWQFDLMKKGGGIKENITIDSQLRKHQQDLLLQGGSSSSPVQQQQSIVNIVNGNGYSFIDSITKDISVALETLDEVHSNHRSELKRVENALLDAEETIKEIESKQHVDDDQLGYLYEFQSFINNMTGCLDEKIPLIEEYEYRLIDLEKDHAYALRKQINDHIKDLANTIEQQAQYDPLDATTAINSNNNDVDEFGRDRSYYENSSREKRMLLVQSKRKQQRNNNNNNNSGGNDNELESMEIDGSNNNNNSKNNNNSYSYEDLSDEEELFDDEDETHYREEKEKIEESLKSVLDDVDEDYCNISNIKERFQHWKIKDNSSYKKVHVSYILPALFAPFVRLQLIDWNPLHNINFDTLKWYTDLSDYGMINHKLDDDDPDANLIPKLIIKLVIPKVEEYTTFIWNPFSRKQTNNLKYTIEEIQVYLEDANDLLIISNKLFMTLAHSVDTLILPVVKDETVEDGNELIDFSKYMFKRCLRLLSAVSVCSSWLDRDNMVRLVLKDIFRSKLIPFVIVKPNNLKEQYVNEIFNCFSTSCLQKLQYSKENFIVELFQK
ncbi:GC-rich sequence DNA-binding factor-like protein [Heterostelium album PN500]|uniref:GC-rich sequence DNA-binding factor-like protein n=1 Tax=Heterostelium pallidum (strain ATCC 26659 / Pp 5 / PN500) TaxID=670386 RepID=D3BJ55_HETP5|nr:GC-rich sequence DNA-binding factor-like protein [Heterostelium album PN500]EFA77935.1 GC-rich sequence DNA-binding factor-like protein [Heterostelium album PN500]|eukprot:XP_020430063.1 GC-rich sequence DNA-binding factor-like protein [Heterostelium album PN500]